MTWGLFLGSPEKPFVKLRPAYSVKLVFSYVVKGIKIKITAKFRASRRLTFEDTKRIMSPDMRPKSFGTFEKPAPVPNWPDSSIARAIHCHHRGPVSSPTQSFLLPLLKTVKIIFIDIVSIQNSGT